MAPPSKTTDEKLRELDRNIIRHEVANAPPPPRPVPPKVTPAPIGRRTRQARRILAVSIGVWCAFCFVIAATGEGVLADPIGLAGLAAFMGLIGVGLYYTYLFQWAVAKEVAGWFRRFRKTGRETD